MACRLVSRVVGNALTFGGTAFTAVVFKAWQENELYIDWGILGRNDRHDGNSHPPASTFPARFCCCPFREL